MKNATKRILSVVLAVAMIMSTFSVAFATEDEGVSIDAGAFGGDVTVTENADGSVTITTGDSSEESSSSEEEPAEEAEVPADDVASEEEEEAPAEEEASEEEEEAPAEENTDEEDDTASEEGEGFISGVADALGTFLDFTLDEGVDLENPSEPDEGETEAATSVFTVSCGFISATVDTLEEALNVFDQWSANMGIMGYPVITLNADYELADSVVVDGDYPITIDLNGHTITGTDNATGSFGLINNKGDLTIKDSVGGGKITLTATNNRAWNAYSSVISNTVGGKLTVESGIIEHLGGTDMAYGIDNLTNGKGTYAETIINGGTVKSTYRAIRQFLNGVEADNILTVNGGTIEGANKSIWVQSPSKNANTGTTTVAATAQLKGDVYIYATAGQAEFPVEISIAADALADGSEVVGGNLEDLGLTLETVNGTYGVVYAPALPTATVTDITADTDDLTFALNFKADDATAAQLAYYGDWYADFVFTVSGLTDADVTFNANGGADGYLSGQYDDWSDNWVSVPFSDVTLRNGESLRIMEYAAELMNKKGLKFTYAEVYDIVKDFDCGVFFEEAFLKANPDIKVTLELRMFNGDADTEGVVIGETYIFEIPALPTATVTDITADTDDLTFALNFKADDATAAQLAYYGDWYADFVFTVSGLTDADVTFNANGGADGYLSGQYDDWSANWVSVPFSDVTLRNGESLRIMEYAAELMNKKGLKFTYAEVYDIVKDFDCGVFFEKAFLKANPDIKVTLELRMFNGDADTEGVVIGETYIFEIPALPTATVTDITADTDNLTFALNFKADDATAAQLAYYGDWYADFVFTVSGLTDADVTFNANGGADGYLSGQYDDWSENWVSVPFSDVTLRNGESLRIMEYAAELMNKKGLKFTYAEVYDIVKDFDCGVFFEKAFLKANPDIKVTLELRMFNGDADTEGVVIGETYIFEIPELPTATVTDITADTDDLTFALNFKADDATAAQLAYYGDWYADFVFTVSRLTDADVTFNANGGADGYLSGQYDDWSANWVSVPFSDVTLRNGESLRIMEYAAELMNKKGLKFTYAEVYDIVKDFDCGVYLEPEFIKANPGAKITLELRMYNNEDESESYSTGEVYEFVLPALPVAKIGEVEYTSLADAVAAAQNGDTIVMLADVDLGSETLKIPAGLEVTLDLNGKVISGVCNADQANMVYVENTAKLTVEDSAGNGKITYASGTSKVGFAIDVKGDFVLNSGTVELTGPWDLGFAVDVRPNAWGTAYTAPTTFVMNGGKIVSSDTAVRVDSNSSDTYEPLGVSFTMNGGEIESGWDAVFVQHRYKNDLSVTINDGKISGANSPLRIYGDVVSDVDIAISGGTFDYTGGATTGWYIENVLKATAENVAAADIAISGGTFEGDVTELCADGYEANDNGNGTWTVEEVEKETKEYVFGHTTQLGLIEPWFLKANLYVAPDAESPDMTAAELENFIDYGAYFVRARDIEFEGELPTAEEIVACDGAVLQSKANGKAIVEHGRDGAMITTSYVEGIYTYELNEPLYVVFFVEDENGVFYGGVRDRNLITLAQSGMNNSSFSETEKAVYKRMIEMEAAIVAHRATFESIPELELQTAPKVAANQFGTFAVNNSLAGNTYNIVLIEPWGVKVNAYVANKEYDDVGFVVLYDKKNAYASAPTAEQVVADTDAYFFSEKEGQATAEIVDNELKISAVYRKDVYTYQLDDNAYVVPYVLEDGVYTFGAVKTRNILSAISSWKDDASYSETERAVYSAMVNMHIDIVAHRATFGLN